MDNSSARELSEPDPRDRQNTPTPDDARQELRDAARETLSALQGNVSMDPLTRRILINQIYMLNVLRWLVAQEADRIRKAPHKESRAASEEQRG